MAKKRMTSLDVIDTDAFIDMPQTSQNLYFHLNGRADDDGFIANQRMIMRMIGASVDDINILVGKKFIIMFEKVCVIKHWRINNNIRKDIYKETKYIDQKKTLFIRKNGTYTRTKDDRSLPVPSGHFLPEKLHVNVTSTQRQHRLGKVRLDKVSIEVPDFVDKKVWLGFIEHRKEVKKKLTQKAANIVFKKFKGVSVKDQQEMLDNAIEGGWTTVYKLKKEKKEFTSRDTDYRSQEKKAQKTKEDKELLKQAVKNNPRLAEILKEKTNILKKA